MITMDTVQGSHGSFSSNLVSSANSPEIKCGSSGTAFISTGLPDLDKILGGGFLLGSLVIVMEDAEAPHHLLLLRNFMSQGLVHDQPLLYAAPSLNPRLFLGTLPNPSVSGDDNKSVRKEREEANGLRIAWQYNKYFGEHKPDLDNHNENKYEYCTNFDLRQAMDRKFVNKKHVTCVSIQGCQDLNRLRDHFSSFLSPLGRKDVGMSIAGRIAIQSLCAPHCQFSHMEWEVLSMIRHLKSLLRRCNAVGMLTFPPSLLPRSFSKRVQHMSDTLISVKAINDRDHEMEKLITGYQDMIGLLNVHKIARFNTQVPLIPETKTWSLKLRNRRWLVLECLNQAPIDAAGESSCSSATVGASGLDF